jgi:hypothetical protein
LARRKRTPSFNGARLCLRRSAPRVPASCEPDGFGASFVLDNGPMYSARPSARRWLRGLVGRLVCLPIADDDLSYAGSNLYETEKLPLSVRVQAESF